MNDKQNFEVIDNITDEDYMDDDLFDEITPFILNGVTPDNKQLNDIRNYFRCFIHSEKTQFQTLVQQYIETLSFLYFQYYHQNIELEDEFSKLMKYRNSIKFHIKVYNEVQIYHDYIYNDIDDYAEKYIKTLWDGKSIYDRITDKDLNDMKNKFFINKEFKVYIESTYLIKYFTELFKYNKIFKKFIETI